MQSLYQDGHRKYLTRAERDRLLSTLDQGDRATRTLCATLAFTGCRISEALALTLDRIDYSAEAITFESLKKRKAGVYRAVPVPPALLDMLDLVHGVRAAQKKRDRGAKLWPFSRMTAYRRIKAAMLTAGLTDPIAATPKGLRHAYGVAAVSAGAPLNLVQRWLGHAELSTTAIYADAIGEEERAIASRVW